jgi:hypothetical protein
LNLQRQAEELVQIMRQKRQSFITQYETFEQVLLQRGYGRPRPFQSDPFTHEPSVYCIFTHSQTYGITKEFFMHRSLSDVAIQLDKVLAEGQHHMRCTCGQPLLYAAGETTPLGYRVHHIYRNACAGPKSAMLERCPACNQELNANTVVEIEDHV